MLVDNHYEHGLAARMEDYFTSSTHWTRQLWRLGTLAEIDELIEASEWHHRGALSEAAVSYLKTTLARRVKADVGLGSVADRGVLIGQIQRRGVPDSHDLRVLKESLEAARPAYLVNWADAVADRHFPLEALGRAVASHLIDCGFSRRTLRGWISYHRRKSEPENSVADLLLLADRMSGRAAVNYELLIPILASPPFESKPDSRWLTAVETAAWLADWFPGHTLRQSGGLCLRVQARDVNAAVSLAADEVGRVQARFRVGARRRLEFIPLFFAIGETEPIELVRRPRSFQVHGLEHTRAIFEERLPGEMDAVLDLLEPLDSGPPAAAVAGGWAALEAMFIGPGDTANRVVAATRMARILACAYVSSELGAVAAAYGSTQSDQLAMDLRRLSGRHLKARRLEEALRSGEPLSFTNVRHKAAVARMQHLVADPAAVIPKVSGQVEDALRRLYRQRNFVVHAGRLTSSALEGALRTGAPLIGAGVDAVARASTVTGAAPLELAAITEVRMHRAITAKIPLADIFPEGTHGAGSS